MARRRSDHMGDPEGTKSSRREFVRKAAYVAPLVTTLHAAPTFARYGSGRGSSGSSGSSGPSWGKKLGIF